MCSSGNMPAQATANSVMASAKRLMELRQVCFSSSRMAEISVPAWPIPIHQTKLMMAKPQPTGMFNAPDADAHQEQVGDRRHQERQQAHADGQARQPAQADRPRQHGIGDRYRSSMPKVCPGPNTGGSSGHGTSCRTVFSSGPCCIANWAPTAQVQGSGSAPPPYTRCEDACSGLPAGCNCAAGP